MDTNALNQAKPDHLRGYFALDVFKPRATSRLKVPTLCSGIIDSCARYES